VEVSISIGRLAYLLPVLVLVSATLLLVVLDVVLRGWADRWLASVGLAAVIVAGGCQLLWYPVGRVSLLGGALQADGFGAVVALAVLVVLGLTLVFSPAYAAKMALRGREYYPLLFVAATGMMLLPLARELLSIIVSIELVSIPLYVLAGYNRGLEGSREAGFKYFLLGAFASAFMVYGAAFLYGTTGSLWLRTMSEAMLVSGRMGLMLAGLSLLLVGFAFKVALVPFHAWVPDVYEGSPSPVTGFMAAGVKLALFAVLLRLLMDGLMPLAEYWRCGFCVLAVLTMCLGNLLALHQMSLKRLLAYSSITHAGYLVLGLLAASGEAITGTLFYLIAYALAIIGTLALISAWVTRERDDVYMDDLRGLAGRQPLVALLLALFMLSLIGFPVTVGFIGKVVLFYAAYQAGFVALLVVAIVNTMVSVYYYLRVVQAMYLLPAGESARPRLPEPPGAGSAPCPGPVAWPYLVVSVAAAVAVIWLGVLPRALLAWLNASWF